MTTPSRLAAVLTFSTVLLGSAHGQELIAPTQHEYEAIEKAQRLLDEPLIPTKSLPKELSSHVGADGSFQTCR